MLTLPSTTVCDCLSHTAVTLSDCLCASASLAEQEHARIELHAGAMCDTLCSCCSERDEFPVGAGVMRGAGRQLLASVLNLITYWGLGLPLCVALGVHYGLGVQGLWWGLATTTSVQVSGLCRCERVEAGLKDSKDLNLRSLSTQHPPFCIWQTAGQITLVFHFARDFTCSIPLQASLEKPLCESGSRVLDQRNR